MFVTHYIPSYSQNTSQYYFVLQSLHKVLPSTTLYYKACTKYFPVLLCTTKLAQSASQYYFCTTKLAKNTSQYYFVLQSLHKTLPSATLYYQACAQHFPVHLCISKLAQNTAQYYFVLQSLHKNKLLHNEVFTQRNFVLHNDNRNCSSKTGSRCQSQKKT